MLYTINKLCARPSDPWAIQTTALHAFCKLELHPEMCC